MDEAPDGAQTLISRGFCNLTHRISDTAPTPVSPGEKMQVTVPLHGTGYRVSAGHRIVVQIASAYWPILWPAPEPVTLSIRAGISALRLPLRTEPPDAPSPRPLPEPANRDGERRITCMREGSMERTVHTDLITGAMTHRVFIDGGVFGPIGDIRLDDIGTVLSDVSERRYTIHPDDPLSAHATMEQTASFTREDWSAKIWAHATQKATATEFVLTSSLRAWSGEELIFEEEKTHVIPRRGM